MPFRPIILLFIAVFAMIQVVVAGEAANGDSFSIAKEGQFLVLTSFLKK
jgi:hypothetical protein